MKLKRYRKRKISTYFSMGLIIIIISLMFAFVIIDYFAKMSNKILLPMAESKTRKVVTMIINDACDESMVSNNLYMINKENDEIKMITYNSFEVTKLINDVTSNIQNKIKDIELGNIDYYDMDVGLENGVIAEIPFGVIFNNALFSNVGPKIKLRLNLLGDVMSNIETEVKPYGINNAYVEVRIKLEVTARIVLPFVSEKVVISNVIPISMNVIEGTVPEAYISSYK